MNIVKSEAVFYSVCPSVGAIKAYLREHPGLCRLQWRFVKVILQPAVSTATFESREKNGYRTEAWVSAVTDGFGGWQVNHTQFRVAR